MEANETEPTDKTAIYVSSSFAKSKEISCNDILKEISCNDILKDKEFATEEPIIFVGDDCSIVIDDNTTFVDEDGNPIFVDRSIQGENIELKVKKGNNDNEDTTGNFFSNDSQGKASVQLGEILISTNDLLLDTYKNCREEDTIMEPDRTSTKVQNEQDQNSNKHTRPSTVKLISLAKHKEGLISDESAAICNNITIIDKESGDVYLFEGTPQNVKADIQEVKEMDRLTCPYCLRKFSYFRYTKKHMKSIHKLTAMKINTVDHCKCVECNISFKILQDLRDHLHCEHNMKMDVQEINFPNMDAFYKWKNEIECKELMRYRQDCGKKKSKKGIFLYYSCHRSGTFREKAKGPDRQRMIKADGTVKMGIKCTSEIKCQEFSGIVKVIYCPHHYGHGKDMTFRQLTEVEQDAIQENISNGIPFDNILGDKHEDTASFQVGIIKQKDMKIIRKAFNSEEYSDLSDAESVNRWVHLCCQMEDSPVLYYRQEENDFLLVIMTEFQKNILLSSDKHILCLDNAHRKQGYRFYLTYLMALDECMIAYPLAFCISNKVDKSVMKQFLLSIRDSTGSLSCTFFMSDSDSFYREAWQEVMEDSSKWLWSKWYIDSRFRMQMQALRGQTAKRADFYRKFRLIVECQNKNIFETMFKNLTSDLCEDPMMKNMANLLLQKYANSKEFWAYCYHEDVKLSSITRFDSLHKTMRFCCREGRKIRLDKFILVIMKLMRFKMLDRLTKMLDEDKISLAVKAINAHHSLGFEIPSKCISSLGDKLWLIQSDDKEGNIYVVHEFDSCPDFCSLKCSECDICIHMFSCSCIHNMVNADLCQHIHAVVWRFLTPHFSPFPSPAHDNYEEIDNIESPANPSSPLELFNTVLKMTREVFKQVRSNKSFLGESALNDIKDYLNKCMSISSGKTLKESQLKPYNDQINDSQLNSCNVLDENSQINSNNVQSASSLKIVCCSNCQTTVTPMWRRNSQGELICNACGLCFMQNKMNRPLTMKTDDIKRKPIKDNIKLKPKKKLNASKMKNKRETKQQLPSDEQVASNTSNSISSKQHATASMLSNNLKVYQSMSTPIRGHLLLFSHNDLQTFSPNSLSILAKTGNQLGFRTEHD